MRTSRVATGRLGGLEADAVGFHCGAALAAGWGKPAADPEPRWPGLPANCAGLWGWPMTLSCRTKLIVSMGAGRN